MAAEALDMNAPSTSEQANPGGLTEVPELNANPAPPAIPAGSPGKPPVRKRGKVRLSPVNFVMIGLYGAGILGVYLLSLRAGLPKVQAAQQTDIQRVEEELRKLDKTIIPTESKIDETVAVVDTFYYEASQRQIPLKQLPVNPFLYVPPDANKLKLTPTGRSVAQIQRAEELARAEEAFKRLELQSVLTGGETPTAIISGNLVSEGQTVDGWTVKSIKSKGIILKWRNQERPLMMPR